MEIVERPQIADYLDYRHFLSDLYHFLKQTEGNFSYRSFAKAAGMNSPSFLKLVIDGKRNLTDDSIEKFAHALKLNNQDSELFRTLVKYNQAGSTEEKIRNYKWLQKLKDEHSQEKLEGSSAEGFWDNWAQIGKNKLKEEGHPKGTLEILQNKIDELKEQISPAGDKSN